MVDDSSRYPAVTDSYTLDKAPNVFTTVSQQEA